MLFETMHQPLLHYAYRFTDDKTHALDVVQDVFLKIWEVRATLDVRVSFKALLYTATRNKALNARRDRQRHAEHVQYGVLDQMHPAISHVEEEIAVVEMEKHFNAWIKQLPPRRQEAFVLSRFHNLSHQEISEIMGLSRRTIDGHILLALRFLRSRFEKLNRKGIEP